MGIAYDPQRLVEKKRPKCDGGWVRSGQNHLRWGDAELDETDLSVLDAGRSTGEVSSLLWEDHAVNELGLIDGTTEALDYLDIVEVGVWKTTMCGGNFHDSVDRERCEQG